MIATANVISHGSISINYITRMGTADVIKLRFIPERTPAESIWNHMQAHRLAFQYKRSSQKPLEKDTIRIEISPAREETEGWTPKQWEDLVDDFIRAFDNVDLSAKAKRSKAAHTTLGNTQLIATLHRDSKSGIVHLHIDGNRIDMDGDLIDAHFIGMRATMAANEVARQRGWVQAEQRAMENKAEIHRDCMSVLRDMPVFSWIEYASRLSAKGYDIQLKRDSQGKVRGYTIRKGNSIYKSSELGRSRSLMPSKIEGTWKLLHQNSYSQPSTAIPTRPDETSHRIHKFTFAFDYDEYNGHTVHNEDNVHNGRNGFVELNVNIVDNVFKSMASESTALSNGSEEYKNVAKIALLLFAGYVDAATAMSESSGGGGSPSTGWGREKDEDENDWARRCAHMAHQMLHTPKRRKGKGLG